MNTIRAEQGKAGVVFKLCAHSLFGADDPDFRVTFDREITTRRTDLELSSGSYGEQLLHPDEVLMEIKINGAIPKWFADILAEEKYT